MPILYVALLNKRYEIVLQGVYKRGGSNFKTSVTNQSYTSKIQLYGTNQIFLDEKLTLIYRNQDSVTAAIVITKEIDLFECGQFFEAFFVQIE